jgi:hypothetical protein
MEKIIFFKNKIEGLTDQNGQNLKPVKTQLKNGKTGYYLPAFFINHFIDKIESAEILNFDQIKPNPELIVEQPTTWQKIKNLIGL